MLALGDYPMVTLAEVRTKCDDIRELVSEGINPTQAKQLDKIKKANESANTFQIIAKNVFIKGPIGNLDCFFVFIIMIN